MDDGNPQGTTNSSTRHVFETLRTIAGSSGPLGLNAIAERLDLPPSTAHRALMTLEECGYVDRVRQAARFEPGATVHHLIRSMVAQFPVRSAAASGLSAMSTDFDVTASLNWRIGWSSIRLASYEGMQESFQSRRIGEIRLLHDGISPSAILFSLPLDEQALYFKQLEHFGDVARFGDKNDIFASQMAEQGYLELPPIDKLGFYWISTPLKRFDGAIGGSVTVGFSMNQRTGADLASDIERVRSVIEDLQASLDAEQASTKTPFDSIDPADFQMLSSPFRAQTAI